MMMLRATCPIVVDGLTSYMYLLSIEMVHRQWISNVDKSPGAFVGYKWRTEIDCYFSDDIPSALPLLSYRRTDRHAGCASTTRALPHTLNSLELTAWEYIVYICLPLEYVLDTNTHNCISTESTITNSQHPRRRPCDVCNISTFPITAQDPPDKPWFIGV